VATPQNPGLSYKNAMFNSPAPPHRSARVRYPKVNSRPKNKPHPPAHSQSLFYRLSRQLQQQSRMQALKKLLRRFLQPLPRSPGARDTPSLLGSKRYIREAKSQGNPDKVPLSFVPQQAGTKSGRVFKDFFL